MKSFFKKKSKFFFMAVFLLFSLVFISACSYSNHPTGPDDGTGGDGDGSYIGHINGFKLVYRPELFEVHDFYESFSTDLIVELARIFGLADFETQSQYIESKGETVDVVPFIYQKYLDEIEGLDPEVHVFPDYEAFENNVRVYFIDDIRNSVYLHTEDEDPNNNLYFAYSNHANHSWKWTHKVETDNTYGYEVIGPITQHAGTLLEMQITYPSTSKYSFGDLEFSWEEKENYYKEFYSNLYGQALQVAVLEILLDKTPTSFAFDFDRLEVMPNPASLLGDGETAGLMHEYQKHAEYIGIKDEDKQKITDYLLDEVIGAGKYLNSEENREYLTSRDDYKYLIETLIWQGSFADYNFSTEAGGGSVYDYYPAISIVDFPSNKMFVTDEDYEAAFAHLPKGELRSVVLMPSKTDYLYEMWFYLAAQREFGVDLHYRYYDGENGLQESPTARVTTIKESSFQHTSSNYVAMNFFDGKGEPMLYKTQPFNNNIGGGVLEAKTQKQMNAQLKDYFEPSKDSFGLNHKKFEEDGSAFFEIVFTVSKGDNLHLDHNFKIGMLYNLFAPEDFLE